MKVVSILIAVAACGQHEDAGGKGPDVPEFPGVPAMTVTSSAFADHAAIPIDHTCEGADVAPPLAWSGAPAATKAYAIIVDDPDAPDPNAPKRTWVHWIVVGLAPTVTSLAGGTTQHLPDGASNGKNDFGKLAWGGPCPPIGRHRYIFKVYALDAPVGALGATKAELLAAMKDHVLARGELVGTYQKTK